MDPFEIRLWWKKQPNIIDRTGNIPLVDAIIQEPSFTQLMSEQKA